MTSVVSRMRFDCFNTHEACTTKNFITCLPNDAAAALPTAMAHR